MRSLLRILAVFSAAVLVLWIVVTAAFWGAGAWVLHSLKRDGWQIEGTIRPAFDPRRIALQTAGLEATDSITSSRISLGETFFWFKSLSPLHPQLRLAGPWALNAIAFDPGDLLVSAQLGADLSLPVQTLVATGGNGHFGDPGASVAWHDLSLNWDATDATTTRLQATINAITLPQQVASQLGGLPTEIPFLRVDATLDLPEAPGLLRATPAVRAITLERVALDWRKAYVGLTGALTADEQGLLSGDVTVSLRGTFRLLTALADSGLARSEDVAAWRSALAGLLDDKGDGTLPLTVRDGVIRLGFVPLGSIPPLL